MSVHWWLPGSIPACRADIPEEFTGEPSEVTCPVCAAAIADPGYPDLVGRRAEDIGYKIEHRLYPWDR